MTFRPPALPWIRTALSLWAAISVHLYTIGSEPELLDLDRIYEAGEFSAKDAGGKWAEDGTG